MTIHCLYGLCISKDPAQHLDDAALEEFEQLKQQARQKTMEQQESLNNMRPELSNIKDRISLEKDDENSLVQQTERITTEINTLTTDVQKLSAAATKGQAKIAKLENNVEKMRNREQKMRVIAVLLPPALAVHRNNFKTCEQARFCKNHRNVKPEKAYTLSSPLTVDGSR